MYAIGDLVLGPALAHKASDEGVIAVEDAAGLETHAIEYIDIPRATFCTPNVGSFGLTEEQAREQGIDVVIGKVQYGAVGAGTVYGDRTGVIKIVGDKKYGELVGGHIVGAKATELIQELVNAKALEGGFPEVARIIHGHPTLAEGVMEAATGRRRLADPRLSNFVRPAKPTPRTTMRSRSDGKRSGLRFYYDFASPEAYLAAERVNHVLPEVPEWIPVRLGGLAAGGVGAFRCAEEETIFREEVEARAQRASAAGDPLARPVPGRHGVRAAGGHLREADRPRRGVLARRVPAGVRGRPRPVRARQRADRRRRVRDAPGRGGQGRRAQLDRGATRRGDRRRRGRRRARRAGGRHRRRPGVPRRPRARGGRRDGGA